jgi:hypothetical protein
MTKSRNSFYDRVNIRKVFEHRRQVAVIWGIEDVQSVRPHISDDQAWEVLCQCRRIHDCSYGFTWELIEFVADDMFPPRDTDETTEEGD